MRPTQPLGMNQEPATASPEHPLGGLLPSHVTVRFLSEGWCPKPAETAAGALGAGNGLASTLLAQGLLWFGIMLRLMAG